MNRYSFCRDQPFNANIKDEQALPVDVNFICLFIIWNIYVPNPTPSRHVFVLAVSWRYQRPISPAGVPRHSGVLLMAWFGRIGQLTSERPSGGRFVFRFVPLPFGDRLACLPYHCAEELPGNTDLGQFRTRMTPHIPTTSTERPLRYIERLFFITQFKNTVSFP